MFKKILFLLFFLLNCNSSYANKDSNCNNVITPDLLQKIENVQPQSIEIKIHKYKKWQINNLRNIMNLAKQGHYGIIEKKYKKNFKATVNVEFNDKLRCSFQAKVRQHGDFADHIELIDGKALQSLDVNLKNGHIKGITKFILLRPEARKNPEEEIIFTELLRTLDFLAPRTSLVRVKLNDLTSTMLFQEKAEKELLEYNLRREGPILEGDERYRYSYGEETIKAQLAKQTNSKWAKISMQHQNISHEAITQLNWFYLVNKNFYNNINQPHILYNINLDNNLLALNNPIQILKLDIYNAILWAANGYHGLIPHNRKFYWNSINNYFEPIYYDGDLTINDGYSKPLSFEFVNFPNKKNFLIGIKNAKQKIKQITIKTFFNQVKFKGSQLSEDEIKKKLNKIIQNLNNLEVKIKKKKNETGQQNKNITINDGMFTNYVDSTFKIGSNFYLVFRDPENKSFKACQNTTLNCNNINLTNEEIADLLKGRLKIKEHIYQYIGEYFGVKDKLISSELNKGKLSKYNKIKFQNTNFYFDKNITFQYDEKNSVFNIYQKYSGARAYFGGGNLNNILINFFGVLETTNNPLKNYPFDKKGLTGCLSFVDLNLKNVSIKSNKSSCEDAINLINVKGSINEIDVKDSFSDGLDVDFSNIEIDYINIVSSKNDCVDFSAGHYKLNKLNLMNCGDKALSVGEKSYLQLNEIIAENSNIGIASKDSSITKLKNVYLKNLKTCISAYNKKQEFYGSFVEIKNIECKNYLKETDIDTNSEIKIWNKS